MDAHAKVRILTADAVEVAAGVVAAALLIHGVEGLGIVHKTAPGRATGGLEAIYLRNECQLVRGEEYQPGLQGFGQGGRGDILAIQTGQGR